MDREKSIERAFLRIEKQRQRHRYGVHKAYLASVELSGDGNSRMSYFLIH